MTNEIIELLEQSEYGIIAINEPNIFLDVCLPAEGCASDVAIWYDDNKKCKAISIYKVDYQKEENTQNQVVARAKAVHHCFAIYNALGLNNNHAKDPFRSKKFIKFYENICDCSKTVYVVVEQWKNSRDSSLISQAKYGMRWKWCIQYYYQFIRIM